LELWPFTVEDEKGSAELSRRCWVWK